MKLLVFIFPEYEQWKHGIASCTTEVEKKGSEVIVLYIEAFIISNSMMVFQLCQERAKLLNWSFTLLYWVQ